MADDRAHANDVNGGKIAFRVPRPVRIAALTLFYTAVASFCVFAIAHALGDGGIGSVLAALAAIKPGKIGASAVCVVLIFFVLWLIERAALDHARAPKIAKRKIGRALVANTVSLGAGFGLLSGGALRARLYAPLGIDAPTAFYIASTVTIASLLGGGFIVALGLILMPGEGLVDEQWRWIGFGALAGIGALLVLCGRNGRAFDVLGRRIELPHAPRLAFWIALGALDWMCSAAALYMLVPEAGRLAFPEFAALFTTSHYIAMMTGAPAGLGVFDALMLNAASHGSDAGAVGAALIVHRTLSFLLPVLLGLLGLLALEAGRLTAHGQRKSGRVAHAFLQAAIGARATIGRARATRKDRLFLDAADAPSIPLGELTGGGAILVLAPHPDDDVLGCGGLIARCVREGIDVRVAYLTDGRHSHFGSRLWSAKRLGEARRQEAIAGQARLGIDASHLTFLNVQDATLLTDKREQARVVEALEAIVKAANVTRVFSAWIHDPHPDHVASALIAQRLHERCARINVASYAIWGRLLPDSILLRDRCWRAVRLDVRDTLEAKRAALAAHRTQTTRLIDDALLALPAPHGFDTIFLAESEIFLV